jgi:hypothetical protein
MSNGTELGVLSVRPGDFPHFIDSTILAAFRSCPRRAYYQYIMHWKPKENSVHLHAGGAFAHGLEAARRAYYEQGADQTDAHAAGLKALLDFYGDFECSSDSAKSLDRMLGALSFYCDSYPFAADQAKPAIIGDRLGIEFQFADPLPDSQHPITGNPLLYTGRADMIADFAGAPYIFDDKTASQLGASWTRQWDLRSQFTGYCWAARSNGIPVAGVIIRGVSILKTKYDTLQAITYRAPWEIERWLKQTAHDVRRMGRCWADHWWDCNLDNACTEYGGCIFRQVCKSPDPEAWLPMGFQQRIWDPLSHSEIIVDSIDS